jgi:hypothetical protein
LAGSAFRGTSLSDICLEEGSCFFTTPGGFLVELW